MRTESPRSAQLSRFFPCFASSFPALWFLVDMLDSTRLSGIAGVPELIIGCFHGKATIDLVLPFSPRKFASSY
jgi:hypothetical protein